MRWGYADYVAIIKKIYAAQIRPADRLDNTLENKGNAQVLGDATVPTLVKLVRVL